MNKAKGMAATALVTVILAFAGVGCNESCNPCPCGPGWSPVEYPSRNEDMVTIQQGLWGDVWFWEGNFQPGCPRGTVTGVARELRIHALTNISQVDQSGYFWKNIETELIVTAHSGENGFFEVELPPGRYSIFALEDTLLYCDTADGKGNLCPITVKEGEVTSIRFDIWYKAAF